MKLAKSAMQKYKPKVGDVFSLRYKGDTTWTVDNVLVTRVGRTSLGVEVLDSDGLVLKTWIPWPLPKSATLLTVKR